MKRITTIVSSVTTLLLAHGCASVDAPDARSRREPQIGQKDHGVLDAIASQPRACAADADCPAGSYCAPGGSCAWDCYASSDCGADASCDERGRCEDGEREPAALGVQRLALISPGASSCSFTDDCPDGQYCDTQQALCAADCAAPGITNASLPGCAPDVACSEIGRCDGQTRATLPRLSLGVKALDLEQPTGTATGVARAVSVQLASSVQPSGSGPEVLVRAVGEGVELSCAPQGDREFSRECTLPAWTFTGTAGRYVATAKIWARLTAGAAEQRSWSIALSSADVIADARSLTLLRAETLENGRPVVGEYAGDLTLAGSQALAAGNAAANVLTPLKVSVRARITADGILFIDDTRQVTASGTLFYPFGTSASTAEVWLRARPLASWEEAITPNRGSLTARVVKDPTPLTLLGRVLRGAFQLTLDLPGSRAMKWSFELSRTSDVAPELCTSAAATEQCGPLAVCHAQAKVCAPAAPDTSEPAGDTLQHASVEAWHAEAGRALSLAWSSLPTSVLFPNPYTSALRSTNFAFASLVTQAPVPASHPVAQFGLSQCRGWFHPAAGSFPIARSARPISGCAVSAATPTPSDVCEQLFAVDEATWNACGGAARAAQGYAQTSLKRAFLPCLYQSASASPRVRVPAELSCENLYWMENNPETTRESFETFLAASCVPSRLSYSIHDPSAPLPNEVEVYLCPDAARASFGNGPEQTELAACYPEANAQAAGYTSQRFGAKASRVTGSILCQDGKTPLELPLLTVRDRSGPALQASSMFGECLSELSASAPDGQQTVPASAITAAFESGACASLGRFATALETARTTFPNYYLELLRQWTGLYAFVATQGRIEWHGSKVLASGTGSGAASYEVAADPRALASLLAVLERGWDLLLSQKHATALSGVGTTLLSYPDYRERYQPTDRLDVHEQAFALAMAVFNGAARHLELVETYLDGVALAEFGSCETGVLSAARADASERAGTALRYALALDRLGESLAAKTFTTAQRGRIDDARQELRAIRHRVVSRGVALSACDNPLALDDESVPLYFSTGSTDEARFFAATRHLTRLAGEAVTDAQGAIDDARAAWINQRSSNLQEVTTAQEAARRIEELKRHSGQRIVDACGLDIDAVEALDRFDASRGSAALRPETCFRGTTPPLCTSGSTLPECLHGALGEALLTSMAANQGAAAALQTWQDAQGAYDSQLAYCKDMTRDQVRKDELRNAHRTHMDSLEDDKFAADVAAIALDAATSCASGATASFGVACATSAGAAIAKGFSAEANRKMQKAEREFAATMAILDGETQLKACAQEARQRHFGIDTARIEYDRRVTESAAALVRFFNLRDAVTQAVTEGRAALVRESARKVPTIAHHYWYDDKVRTFAREQGLAQKYAYIAVQAVEYEMQLSTGLRGAVVRAKHPDELEGVLDELATYTETNSIGGRRASTTSFVLSLRDDILGLRVDKATGQEIDPFEINARLRRRLLAPESAMYDQQGNYLGQGLRFAVSSQTTSRTSSRCAERLWSVAASVVGDQLTTSSNVQLELWHRNTFASKWCSPELEEAPLQVGKFRAGGSLFGATPAAAYTQDAAGYLAATLTAGINVPRAKLDAGELMATEELAARGLYGDYVLLFPGDVEELDLSALEDVLIRFEYVSVNRGTSR